MAEGATGKEESLPNGEKTKEQKESLRKAARG